MHTDPELLGLLALGEPAVTDVERAHLDHCPQCARELAELEQLAHLGRRISPETAMATPSRDVWARIRSELDLDPSLEPPTHGSLFLPSDPLVPSDSERPADPPASPRRRLLAAIRSALGAEHSTHYTARLQPADAEWADATGTAELGTDEHGRRVLTLALDADLPTYGIRQAWLVHRTDGAVRQSVGILDGRNGLWTVDHGLDIADFGVVEVSQQALGAAYSGEVVVRGELVPAS